MTRLDEYSPLWQNFTSIWLYFRGAVSIWQHFEPTLAIFMISIGQILHGCPGEILKNDLEIWSHWYLPIQVAKARSYHALIQPHSSLSLSFFTHSLTHFVLALFPSLSDTCTHLIMHLSHTHILTHSVSQPLSLFQSLTLCRYCTHLGIALYFSAHTLSGQKPFLDLKSVARIRS